MGIKWFFALNDAGGNFANYAVMSQVAVLSARRYTTLEAHFLFDGAPCVLTEWMQQQGVRVIHHRTSVYDRLRQHATETGMKNTLTTGAGAFLRLDIPEVCAQHGIDDPFVLYTDCDVLFLRDIEPGLANLDPRYFAAAPQFHQHDASDMNSGVLWMNLENLRGMQDRFRDFIRTNLDTLRLTGFDQAALRAFYGRRRWGRPAWDELPLTLNWKPHWGRNDEASIVHFHGPKPTQRVQLARRTAPATLVKLAGPEYYAYCLRWDEFARELAASVAFFPPARSRLSDFPPVIADFDEALYAAENLDVAVAVQSGYYRSGLEHYLTAGFWEDRAGVQEVLVQQVQVRLAPVEPGLRPLRPGLAPLRAARIAGRLFASLSAGSKRFGAPVRRARPSRTLVLGNDDVARYLACLTPHPVTTAPPPWGPAGANLAPIAHPARAFDNVLLVMAGAVPEGWESSEWMREIARVTQPGGIVAAWFDSQKPVPARNKVAGAKRVGLKVRRNRWFEVLAQQAGVGGDRAGLVMLRRRTRKRRTPRPA
ncbi:MAG: hypothetical protein ACT4PZ_12810 [Panacagrimonas sp.]